MMEKKYLPARIFTAKDSSNISIFAHGKTDVNFKIWDLYLDENSI